MAQSSEQSLLLKDRKAQHIQKMFAEIANSYDQANSILSLGIHHLWKAKLVSMTPVVPGSRVLDCATGTGDLALAYKRKVGTQGHVIGTDFCQEMLDKAPDKAKKLSLEVDFRWADVTNLPFADAEFDAVSISFGIRNVENRDKAYREMARVTKPGGHVMVLEFGQIQIPGIKQLYSLYADKVLPRLGGLISGRPEAYDYLNKSSQIFPCGQDFAREVMATGLYQSVDVTPLSLGVAFIYKCQTRHSALA